MIIIFFLEDDGSGLDLLTEGLHDDPALGADVNKEERVRIRV